MKDVAGDGFSRFQSGHFSLKNERKEGHPQNVDSEELETVVRVNPTINSRKLAEQFHADHTTVLYQLKRIGNVSTI